MEKIKNAVNLMQWTIRKKLNLKRQTVAPIQWSEPRMTIRHQPTQNIQKTLCEKEIARLKIILDEFTLISRLSTRFPSKISDSEWRTILKCETRKERFDQLIFLHKIEKLREKEAKKAKLLKELKNEERKENQNGYRLLWRPARNDIYESIRCLNAFRLSSPTLVVDCQFLPNLSHRGLQLTMQQLKFLISDNKKLENPFRLYFVNYNNENNVVKEAEKKHLPDLGLKNISPIVSKQCFTELFNKEQIIYLSPDGEEVLETVDDDKIYIIGGIVDRVVEKKIDKKASKIAATNAGVKCVRLPIDENIQFNSGSKFLTLIAVMNILNEVNIHGNWKKAMENNIPVRNVKKAEEKNAFVREFYNSVREFNNQILKIVEQKLGKDENQR